jgi:hypothetical protein
VVILGLFFPWRVTFGLTSSLLMAQGRFKLYAWLTLLEGAGFTGACCVGALIEESPESISLAGGTWLAVSRIVINIWLFRGMGVSAWGVCRSMIPPWLTAIAAAACGIGLDRLVGPSLGGSLPRLLSDVVRVGVIGGAFGVVFLVLTRVFLGDALRDALAVTPRRVRPIAARLMGVRPESVETL